MKTNDMNILQESRVMLELAISCLQRSGYDTEQFEQTVAKIKHEENTSLKNQTT
jgi:hypothetical protein